MDEHERRATEQLKRSMIEAIETYFEEHLGTRAAAADGKRQRVNVAAAALLIETTRADHEISDEERLAVTRAVQRTLGLSGAETAQLVRFAEQEVRQATPIYEFTRLVEKHADLVEAKIRAREAFR